MNAGIAQGGWRCNSLRFSLCLAVPLHRRALVLALVPCPVWQPAAALALALLDAVALEGAALSGVGRAI